MFPQFSFNFEDTNYFFSTYLVYHRALDLQFEEMENGN